MINHKATKFTKVFLRELRGFVVKGGGQQL